MINSQRLYWKNRKLISEKTDRDIQKYLKIGIIISAILLVYGVGDYFIYKYSSLGKQFSYLTFLFGTSKCT